MTENEKQQILNLRKTGLGYKRISQELGISVNTIKSFCKRAQPSVPVCEICGTPLSKKQQRFCSSACKNKWWNSHPAASGIRVTTRKCPCCNKEFKSYSSKQRKFCSPECYFSFRFHKQEAAHE